MQTSLTNFAVENTVDQKTANSVVDNKINSIDYWRKKKHWSKKYFEQDSQIQIDLE